MARILRECRQPQLETGASELRAAPIGEVATLRAHEVAADREPQPHAIWLGGVEGLEQLPERIHCNPGAGILDGEPHRFPIALRAQPYFATGIAACPQCIDGVAEQVVQHDFERRAVGPYGWQIVRKQRLQADALALQAW